MEPKASWTDQQVEQTVGRILRTGVLIAAMVVFIGGILYLIHYGTELPDYHVFHGEPSDLRSVSLILQDAWALHRRGLIQFGILLLMATPVVRVAFSLFAFAKEHDRTYMIVTSLVLALLLYSLAGGRL